MPEGRESNRAEGVVGEGQGRLLLLTKWAGMRETAGVSAAFNLANSVAGACGDGPGVLALPPAFASWAAAATIGGVIGSGLGTHRLGSPTLPRLLAFVLAIAVKKLVLLEGRIRPKPTARHPVRASGLDRFPGPDAADGET